ncbi:phBC6A51 family helix-turn-helix protein [Lysinibacillus capsici]|uniref:phBC6A51 family helix-turn-helix protein n=1 Tax=Lysinibacillus capsici TaxID=2115968 RepID=UPI0034E1D898
MEDRFNSVPAPPNLSPEQIRLAKLYVKERHETRITVGAFCSKYKKSTATFTEWKKQPEFAGYLVSLGGSLVSEDSWATYEVVKRKIEAMATAEKAGVKEIQLYLQTFDHIVQADRQRHMEALGINDKGINTTNTKTVEERKAVLLTRLKGETE